MQRIEFTNSKGKIVFANGLNYLFVSFNPNEGSTEHETALYVGQDGEDVLGGVYEPRELSFDGYILADNNFNMINLRKNMTKIMNGKDKGVLRYYDGARYYKAECIAEIPSFGTAIKNNCLPFTVDLLLYNFYWKSDGVDKANIYQREDMLTNPFVFPIDDSGIVFTVRENKATITNSGDVSAPVVFKITAKKINNSAYTGHGFEVKNNTTGEYIKLVYDMADNEVVTIDTEEMTVTSNINGNIMYSVEEYSTPNLKLEIGNNEIECLNYDNTTTLSITSESNKLYVGV